jgi:hypothetical protein
MEVPRLKARRFTRIDGFPGYWVTHWGEVYSFRKFGGGFQRDKPLRRLNPLKTNNRYLTVVLTNEEGRRIQKTIHSLVLESFDGPRPNGFVCRHLDGNSLNNHIDNLQWGTDQENADDRLRHGTQVRCEKQHLAKLNAADVLEIRRLWDTTRIQQKELAERFNTTQANISMVVLRKTWIHI